MRSVEGSLKRLKTDYIDLLWLHAWDFMTPVEEVMRGLDDLVSAGKVNYVGISDTPAWIVSQANTLADLRGWTPLVALQIEYSLIERTVERDLIPMAKAFGLTVTPWSPLGQGILTGKYNGEQKEEGARLNDGGSARLTEHNLSIAQTVVEVAAEIGRTPSQVALAWLHGAGTGHDPDHRLPQGASDRRQPGLPGRNTGSGAARKTGGSQQNRTRLPARVSCTARWCAIL